MELTDTAPVFSPSLNLKYCIAEEDALRNFCLDVTALQDYVTGRSSCGERKEASDEEASIDFAQHVQPTASLEL